MKEYLTNERYHELVESSQEMHLNTIWYDLRFDFSDFHQRTEAFFWVLEKALLDGSLKLQKGGVLRTETPEELVQMFRDAFPKSDIWYPSQPDMDAGFWFFYDECPGEAVWRVTRPDGSIEWVYG